MVSIENLILAIGEGKILITDHADEEAEAYVLTFDEVYFSVVHGEIIEEYPTDQALPKLSGVWAYLRSRPSSQRLGVQ